MILKVFSFGCILAVFIWYNTCFCCSSRSSVTASPMVFSTMRRRVISCISVRAWPGSAGDPAPSGTQPSCPSRRRRVRGAREERGAQEGRATERRERKTRRKDIQKHPLVQSLVLMVSIIKHTWYIPYFTWNCYLLPPITVYRVNFVHMK